MSSIDTLHRAYGGLDAEHLALHINAAEAENMRDAMLAKFPRLSWAGVQVYSDGDTFRSNRKSKRMRGKSRRRKRLNAERARACLAGEAWAGVQTEALARAMVRSSKRGARC